MLVEPEPSGEGSVRYRGMLFAVTATDSNGDGVLDDEDEIRALAVDDDGRNPRFVTPAGTRMTSVHYEEASGLAYLMVSTDEDGDGEFSEKETPRPYLYRFGENQAEPLLRAETVEAIQGAMDGARRVIAGRARGSPVMIRAGQDSPGQLCCWPLLSL